jgi:hypothetical protein
VEKLVIARDKKGDEREQEEEREKEEEREEKTEDETEKSEVRGRKEVVPTERGPRDWGEP